MTLEERSSRGNLWRTVKAVAWGFFGVRKNSSYQEDISRLKPLHIVGVGIAAAALFVVALVVIVALDIISRRVARHG